MKSELDQLAFKFFKLFAQYEFALKVMKYTKTSNGPAEPAWDKFSNEVGEAVFSIDNQNLRDSIEYLLAHPPKKQVVVNGVLDWQEASTTDRSPQALFAHIRRVRNNLYHGGKFNGVWFAPERSGKLIECSMVVLNELRKSNQKLKEIVGNIA